MDVFVMIDNPYQSPLETSVATRPSRPRWHHLAWRSYLWAHVALTAAPIAGSAVAPFFANRVGSSGLDLLDAVAAASLLSIPIASCVTLWLFVRCFADDKPFFTMAMFLLELVLILVQIGTFLPAIM